MTIYDISIFCCRKQQLNSWRDIGGLCASFHSASSPIYRLYQGARKFSEGRGSIPSRDISHRNGSPVARPPRELMGRTTRPNLRFWFGPPHPAAKTSARVVKARVAVIVFISTSLASDRDQRFTTERIEVGRPRAPHCWVFMI